MGENIKDFRDLIGWRKAILFAKEVYRLTRCFSRDERFGLTAQVRRADVSVSSNTAEGHARQEREFAHLLSVVRGSLAESESQLLLAWELDSLRAEDHSLMLGLASEIRRMAAALANRLT